MTRFGHAALVGFDHRPDGGAQSYDAQVTGGVRRDTMMERLRYFARANYAHNYIHWLRKASNDPAFLTRAAQIERRLIRPFTSTKPATARAQKFHDLDYCAERGMIARETVLGLRDAVFGQSAYYDPYDDGYVHRGRPETSHRALLSIDPQTLFENPFFLAVCATPDLIACCRELLGPAAAVSWAWGWVSNPQPGVYQSQQWHRDCSEPLNFVRVFVPLTDIRDLDDGPTALIPATSRHRDFYEVRRYSDDELDSLQAEKGAGMVPADVGDVYFVNTFAIHRAVPPKHMRGMMTLLVSLSPSHRSPAIKRMRIDQAPAHLRPVIAANRSFFRYLFV